MDNKKRERPSKKKRRGQFGFTELTPSGSAPSDPQHLNQSPLPPSHSNQKLEQTSSQNKLTQNSKKLKTELKNLEEQTSGGQRNYYFYQKLKH